MAFVLRPGKRIGEELLRLARQELRRAVASLRGAAALGRVHDARKRVKKVRAVMKLLSAAHEGPWTKSDKRLRAAGRLLSDLRDTDALVETLDELRKRHAKRLSAASYRAIRRLLIRRRRQAMTEASDRRHLKGAAEKLEKVRRATKQWHAPSIKTSQLPELLGESFRASRKAMNVAARKKKAEAVHDWRKRVKTFWYHLRLVTSLAPGLGHRIRSLRSLEHLLGDDHNLEVLCVSMADDRDRDLQLTSDRRELILVARSRQSVVRRQAFALGKRVNAMTTKQFARSVRLH